MSVDLLKYSKSSLASFGLALGKGGCFSLVQEEDFFANVAGLDTESTIYQFHLSLSTNSYTLNNKSINQN